MTSDERCRPLLDDNGQAVARVRGEQELTERGREAMLELVAAVQRDMAERDPDGTLGERQVAAVELIRAKVRRRAVDEVRAAWERR